MSSSSSVKDPQSGNTRQIAPAKNWCFTLNNYVKADIDELLKFQSSKKMVFQEEIGEQGTPHLQGVISFEKKVRPKNIFKFSQAAHWEKMKGTFDQARDYCSKEDTRKPGTQPYTKGVKLPKNRKLNVITSLRPGFQEYVNNLCKEQPDDRAILWFYEEVGNVGKSALAKYLCFHYNAIICSGKAADIKYMCVKYNEKNGFYPEIVICDIPRSSANYLSYTGLEEVKNGCFMSSKYECDVVLMNPPHLICFANFYPDTTTMSKDRWVIHKLDEKGRFLSVGTQEEYEIRDDDELDVGVET